MGQFQDGPRCECLRGKTHAEERFGSVRPIRGHVRFAQAGDPLRTIAVHDSNRNSRRLGVFQDLLELLLEFADRLCGLRRVVFFFAGKQRREAGTEQLQR